MAGSNLMSCSTLEAVHRKLTMPSLNFLMSTIVVSHPRYPKKKLHSLRKRTYVLDHLMVALNRRVVRRFQPVKKYPATCPILSTRLRPLAIKLKAANLDLSSFQDPPLWDSSSSNSSSNSQVCNPSHHNRPL